MSALLKRLLAYLALGVDEPAPEPEPTPEPEDDSLESLLEATEPTPTPREPEPEDPAAELARERREARQAREELERERTARRDAESRAAPPPRPASDPDYDREEQELAQAKASGATAEQLSWLQWKIDSNRKMRTSERTSQGALQAAQDLRDQTDFDRIKDSHPKTYNRYKDRVEQAVNDLRSKGQQVPMRRAILALFIGQDSLEGKIKPKAAKSPAEGADRKVVDRGKTPGARTDVSSKGGLTERQKRAARLEGRPI